MRYKKNQILSLEMTYAYGTIQVLAIVEEVLEHLTIDSLVAISYQDTQANIAYLTTKQLDLMNACIVCR